MLGVKTMNKASVLYLAAVFTLLACYGCGQRVGPAGPQGAPGPQGVAGVDGQDGEDAMPVTVVTLCPAVTTYPSTFTEVAFCIGGKLYATYSANGGFSTEIPPGNYISNGISSSCTFTVGPNCQVSH